MTMFEQQRQESLSKKQRNNCSAFPAVHARYMKRGGAVRWWTLAAAAAAGTSATSARLVGPRSPPTTDHLDIQLTMLRRHCPARPHHQLCRWTRTAPLASGHSYIFIGDAHKYAGQVISFYQMNGRGTQEASAAAALSKKAPPPETWLVGGSPFTTPELPPLCRRYN